MMAAAATHSNKRNKRGVIVLAAGGTGGHVFPAIAVGETLHAQGFTPYFITDKRGQNLLTKHHRRFNNAHRHRQLTIGAASPFVGNPLMRLVRLITLGMGFLVALIAVIKHRPHATIGFGGYPAVAPVVASYLCRVPIILHEQNAHAGRANQFLSRFATSIALSWPRHGVTSTNQKYKVVGTPVRNAFFAISKTPYTPPSTTSPIRLLVVGGSLGASIFATLIPSAMEKLPNDLRRRVTLTQQVRGEEINQTTHHYKTLGIPARITPFITDMAKAMGEAHLVICRAGASSIAELAAAGRPAILVPYPHALDDHQTSNANMITRHNGGWLLPEAGLTPDLLAKRLTEVLTKPAVLAKAAKSIQQLGRVHAAKSIAELAIASGMDMQKPQPKPIGGKA